MGNFPHLVEAVLPLDDHAQVLVVEDEHLDFQLLDGSRRHLLAIHQEAAVPINVHHHLHKQHTHHSIHTSIAYHYCPLDL